MPYVPKDDRPELDKLSKQLAEGIAGVAKKYKYKGACLGEMNYAITRLIQHLPRALMETGEASSELRYWMQAGMYGVLLDVILEHKVRVNQSYEITQIKKSGDCYDTPYYSKPVEVQDASGKIVGHVYINMERTDGTVLNDLFNTGFLMLSTNSDVSTSCSVHPEYDADHKPTNNCAACHEAWYVKQGAKG
jgi:hypothetical protein